MATRKGTIAEQVAQIRKRLGHLDIQWSPAHWLDLGTEEVNRVFGHKELGMAYGRIVEIAGLESNGKTALALTLCAIAQQEGAAIIWQDLENSFSEDWAAMRGLDTDAVALVRPRLVQESKKKGARLSSAEELCAEATTYMDELAYEKAILVVDSIPSMQTALAQEAGSDKQNMRTKMDLPMFLSQQLRDWINRAVARNVMIVLINQLRQQPNVPFGDPWYTPGGNAVRFYSHVRLRIRRGGSKAGTMRRMGLPIGIQGVITAVKNKAGGEEGSQIGYQMKFDGPFEFVDAKDAKKAVDLDEEDDAGDGEE